MAYTNATLRTKLAASFPGIDLDTTIYPDAESMLKAVVHLLSAAQQVQETHNAIAPTGEDIQLIGVGVGADQLKDIGGGVFKTVRLVNRAVTVFEENTVTAVYAQLI